MGNYVTHAEALRLDTTTHYNCGQSVLVPFAKEMGYTPEQVFQLGAHLGGGMKHGSVCGALSGALIALGALGYDDGQARTFIRNFQTAYGSTQCSALLSQSAKEGIPRNQHCNHLVMAMAAELEALITTTT